MAFEREKRAANEIDRANDDLDVRNRDRDRGSPDRATEVEQDRERERQAQRAKKKRAAEPGRTTLVQQQGQPGRNFHGEAMADVYDAVRSIARGERAGEIAQGPDASAAMYRVAEARAVTLHRHAVESGEVDAHDPAVDESLRRAGAGGQALPAALKKQMEDEFGISFDRVRIHTDAVANDAARAIKAEAFTVGEDIFFAAGSFSASSPKARSLVAHELAHVVQGWQGRTAGGGGRQVSKQSDSLEVEAEAIAHKIEQRIEQRVENKPAQGRLVHDKAPALGPVAPAMAAPAPVLGAKPLAAAVPTIAPMAPAAAAPAGGMLLRKPSTDTDNSAAPTGNGGQPAVLPNVDVEHDTGTEAANDQQANQAAAEHKQADQRSVSQLGQHVASATKSTSEHVAKTMQDAKNAPAGVGAKQAIAQAQTDHAQAQATLNTHTADHNEAAQGHAADAHEQAGGHEAAGGGANPSSSDGVGGIQFKKVSDWSKLMPKPLPNTDSREKQRIEKLVQAKVEKERRESATMLASLRSAQLKAAKSIRAMKGGLEAQISSAQKAALGKVSAAEAAQSAAISSSVAGQQAAVRAAATAQTAAVNSAYTATVSAINQQAQQATSKLQQAHAKVLATMQSQEAAQHTAITGVYKANAAKITALGAAKATEAAALPSQVSLPYSGDQLSAAKKAAEKVGQEYSADMPGQASKANSQIGSHEPESQQAVTKITQSIQEKLEDAFSKVNQAITQTREASLKAAEQAKTSALQQIQQSSSSTVAQLGAFGAQQVSAVRAQGAAAQAGITKAGASSIAGIGQQIDQSAHGLETGAQGLSVGAKDVETPTVEATKEQVQKASADLSKGVPSIVQGLHKSAQQSASALGTQAAGAASGMEKAAQAAIQQATQMGQGAIKSLTEIGQHTTQGLDKIKEGAQKQFDQAVEGGEKAFDACTKGQQEAYKSQTEKLKTGLDGAYGNVEKSFNDAVPKQEKDAILKAAAKAAASVPKHWWQKALAFVVSVVVSIVVVVVVSAIAVALVGTLGPIGLIIVGAIGGALASVLSTMASNLVLGNGVFDGITWQTVAMGAISGAVGGALSGYGVQLASKALGSTFQATMDATAAGVQGLGGMAIRTGVNSVIGMASDAVAQLIVTQKYEFSMTTLVTTIGLSAATSGKSMHDLTSGEAKETTPEVKPPEVNTGEGGAPAGDTGGSGSAPSNEGAPSAKGDTGGGQNGPAPANENAPASNSTPAKGDTGTPPAAKAPSESSPAPAPADKGAAPAPAPADKGATPAPTDKGAAPGGEQGGPQGNQPGQSEAKPAGGQDPGAQQQPAGQDHGAPANDKGAPAGEKSTPNEGEHPPANSDPNAQHAANGDPNAQHGGADPNAQHAADPSAQPAAKGQPAAEKPGQTPAATDKAPGSPAGEQHAPEAHEASANASHEGGGGGGGGGDEAGGGGGSATDQALEGDHYDNASPTNKAKTSADIRAGKAPDEANVRDTASNQTGRAEVERLNPQERQELARSLDEKPEATGDLHGDVANAKAKVAAEQKANPQHENAQPQGEGAPASGADPSPVPASPEGAAPAAHDTAPADPAAEQAPAAGEKAPAGADAGPEGSIAPDGTRRMSPEDVLRHGGMSEDEVQLVRKALTKDAQASKPELNSKMGDGSMKEPLTEPEKAALIKAHDILLRDVAEGSPMRKVVPNKGLGSLLNGEGVRESNGVKSVSSTDKMYGDIGLQRNTDGLNAEQTIAQTGLDYEHSPNGEHAGAGPRKGDYTDMDGSGHVSLSQEVQDNGLHYIDMPMSGTQAKAAQVPLAEDMYAAAKAHSANPERYAPFDRPAGKNGTSGQDNPYTGTGGTSPNNFEVKDFEVKFNQELKAGGNAIVEGAQLKVRGANAGEDQVVATYTKNADGSLKWHLSDDLTPKQKSYYKGLIDNAKAEVDAVRNPKPAAGGAADGKPPGGDPPAKAAASPADPDPAPRGPSPDPAPADPAHASPDAAPDTGAPVAPAADHMATPPKAKAEPEPTPEDKAPAGGEHDEETPSGEKDPAKSDESEPTKSGEGKSAKKTPPPRDPRSAEEAKTDPNQQRRYARYKSTQEGKGKTPASFEDWWSKWGNQKPHNQWGGGGDPDHVRTIDELMDKARAEFGGKEGYEIRREQPITGLKTPNGKTIRVTREPDVSVVDKDGVVRKVYEAARSKKNGDFVKREMAKKKQYDALGIPSQFEQVKKAPPSTPSGDPK